MSSGDSIAGWKIAAILTVLMMFVTWGMMVSAFDSEQYGAAIYDLHPTSIRVSRTSMLITAVVSVFHFVANSFLYLPHIADIISYTFSDAKWILVVGMIVIGIIWGVYFLSGQIQPAYRKNNRRRY